MAHSSTFAEIDPVLAELVEEITRRLRAGEVVDLEDDARRLPRWSGPLRRLMPTLRGLAGLEPTVVPDGGGCHPPDQPSRPGEPGSRAG